MAQSAADRARGRGLAVPGTPPAAERRRRQAQSDNARARAQRWADLPEEERRRRQAQSDADRARAWNSDPEVAELQNNEVLQAMWDTILNGGDDFMCKGDR
ncbi:hypothetical protein I6A62_28210 [Frankia sp. AgW1.1]|nr:hypothetical protein [Frankia sp. AgW1.1]